MTERRASAAIAADKRRSAVFVPGAAAAALAASAVAGSTSPEVEEAADIVVDLPEGAPEASRSSSTISRRRISDALKSFSSISSPKSGDSEESQKNFMALFGAASPGGHRKKTHVKILKKKRQYELKTRELGGGILRYYLEEVKTGEEEELSDSRSSMSITRVKSAPISPEPGDKRMHTYKELLSSEKTYIDFLNLCITAYIAPMRTEAAKLGITAEHISAIFSNLESIVGFQTAFLAEMEAKGIDKLPEVVKKYADFLKMYVVYVKNYENSMKTINDLRSNDKFTKFLNDKRMDSCKGQDISSFLIMPIQRIPRYLLLLQQLQKFATSEAEVAGLEEALKKISDIAAYVDESKKKLEEMNQLMEIQNKMTGHDGVSPIFAPHRHLLGQFEVQEVTSGVLGSGLKDRILFLFTDLIVWTSKEHQYKGQASIIHKSFHINDYKSKDSEGFELFSDGTTLTAVCEDKANKIRIVEKILEASADASK